MAHPTNSPHGTITIHSNTSSIDIPAEYVAQGKKNEVTTTLMNGKEVKVMIKQVYKHTAACEACRARKRKCDGQAPCSYCASKQLQCTFLPQRKRGPNAPKKRRMEEEEVGTGGLVAARHESEILDIIEGNNFNNFYGKFVKILMPITSHDFMQPTSLPLKVQSYIALAYIARISGEQITSHKYISQARILGGAIYDSPDPESVAAMMMFASYWKLVNNQTLGKFYVGLATNLADMVPASRLSGKLNIFLKMVRIMANPNMTRKQVAGAMKIAVEEYFPENTMDTICKVFVKIVADMMEATQVSMLGPDARALELKFRIFDDISVSEEDRMQVQKTVGESHEIIELFASTEISQQLKLMHGLECPLYLTIVDLKSGHIQEGVNSAYNILAALQRLQDNNALGVTAELPWLLMLGGTCRTLYRLGYTSIALQLFEFVKLTCQLMTPEYNFVLLDTEFSPDGGIPTSPIFDSPHQITNFASDQDAMQLTNLPNRDIFQHQITNYVPDHLPNPACTQNVFPTTQNLNSSVPTQFFASHSPIDNFSPNTSSNFANIPPNYTNSPPNYANTSPNYTNSPPNYTNSPPNYTNSPPNYTNSPPNYINSPPNYTNSPPNSINSPNYANISTNPTSPNFILNSPNRTPDFVTSPNLATPSPTSTISSPNSAITSPTIVIPAPNFVGSAPASAVSGLSFEEVQNSMEDLEAILQSLTSSSEFGI